MLINFKTLKAMNIKVRQAEEKDLKRIAEIEAQSFDHPWTLEMIKESLDNEMNIIWVADAIDGDKKDVAGFLIAFCIPAVNAEICDIAVDPRFRRNKVAHNLINYMLCYCNLIAVEKILLDVNVNNAGAIALYKSFDFIEDGIRPKYYENKDDAILMSRVVTVELKPLDLD